MTVRTARGRQMLAKRAAVFAAVVHHWQRNSRAPTTKELCVATGLRSTETVNRHLRGLKADGLVDWDPDKKGTVHLTVAVSRVG